jgi:hypothetical protein
MTSKKELGIASLDQWVDVAIVDGNTVTTLYPDNATMLKALRERKPTPDMIYRRFHFRNGVPSEYYWATRDAARRQWGGMAIQRMSVEAWLLAIKREGAIADGHLRPCGAILPRPKKRGGCDCPACEGSREKWERQAIEVA